MRGGGRGGLAGKATTEVNTYNLRRPRQRSILSRAFACVPWYIVKHDPLGPAKVLVGARIALYAIHRVLPGGLPTRTPRGGLAQPAEPRMTHYSMKMSDYLLSKDLVQAKWDTSQGRTEAPLVPQRSSQEILLFVDFNSA